MENFLAALQQSAKNLEVVERQKVVRLVIKQIVVNGDSLSIQHSIPISRTGESQSTGSYALCTRRPVSSMRPGLKLLGFHCLSVSFFRLPFEPQWVFSSCPTASLSAMQLASSRELALVELL